MLENWDKVQKYAQTGANSAGTAMEKYGIILESVEAKQAQLTAKVQEFYSSILNGGLIAGLLDVGKAFMDIVNIGDGFVGKILLLTTAFIGLNVIIKSLKSTQLATYFSSTLSSIGAVLTGVTTLNGAFLNLGTSGIGALLLSIPKAIAGLISLTAQFGIAEVATLGFKGALDLLNIDPVMLAISALVAVTGGAIAIISHIRKKQQEELKQSRDNLKQYQSDIQSLNGELETNKQKILELQGAKANGTATITDIEELRLLQQENADLEKQIKLLEAKSNIEQKKVRSSFIDNMDDYTTSTVQMGMSTSITDEDTFKALIESANRSKSKIIKIQDEIDKAYLGENEKIAKKKQKELDDAQKEYDAYIKSMKNQLTELEEFADGVEYIKNPKTQDEKKVNEYLDMIQDMQNQLLLLEQGDDSKTTIFDSLFTSDKYADVYNNLTKLAEQGKLTAESLNSEEYADFISNIEKYGITINGVINYLNGFSDTVMTTSTSVDDLSDKLVKFGGEKDSIKNAISGLSSTELNRLSIIVNGASKQYSDAIKNYVEVITEAEKSGADLSQTIYGNIDTNNRQVLNWTDENLKKYKDAIKSWGMTAEELKGSFSTVLGSAGTFGNIDIAFSPILQTDEGAVLLEEGTVNKYIENLIAKACKDDGGWSNEELFRLDSEGLEVDGRQIKNLLADIGDTAVATSEQMHFTGDTGAIQDALRSLIGIFDEVDNSLNRVTEGFSNAKSNARSYKETMKTLSDGEKSTEYDTAFNAHTDAVKALEKEFKKGTVGSKKFAESAKYLFGESFDVTNVDEVYKRLSKLQKLFKEGTYGEGLLKRLKELGKVGDSWAKKNKDGTWDFNIDTSEKGIKQLAEQLGIAEDGVWSCLLALQMFGKIDIFDTKGIENYANQLGLVDEIMTKINGKEKPLKSLNVAQLRDTLDQAGVNVENLDEALAGLEKKGYILIDVAGDAQSLANQMGQIGLVASNGAVELGVLVDTLSNMGYTSGQIQTVIDKLKTVDSVTIDGKEVKLQVQGDEEANQKLNKVKSQENEVSENKATATVAVKGAEEANSKIRSVSNNLSSLNGKKAVTTIITRKITEHSSTGDGGSDLKGVGNNFSGKSHLKGTAFTQGNWGAKRTETALVGEVEPEIWVHADTGKWELVTHPQFLRIKKGDVIFNGQQTRDLLGKGSSLSFGTSFLGGTAYYGATGFGGADWNKRRYPNSGSGSGSGSRGGSTKKKNTGSGGTDKKWWETQLENLKDNLDYNAITMDTYINGIENILKKLKIASKDWKEVNKELQSAKLERVENQFDRGEITIDKYISKLTELRKSYKKNSEGYKELTQKINEAKSDKFTDQYERGEISLKSYITQLTKLRNSYKKNSEEWKKYNDLIKETKLNNLNDRYERGKITTDEYIKGLLKLADTYKDGSKEAKEFEKTVMDAYADNMADKYERGEISLKKYIDELIYMRSHYKKNTEEWKKYNDLIKETKLDDINDRYERSKITTDEYIKSLLKLANTYKDGSKEAKEFENTIMETYADNMADKYERGEISFKKYIDELIYMRSHYKKNTEEWKKYNDLINSTKADYYADQYERGKISADTYIQKLEELRKACKKGSEEYKEYTDEINNAKLDKAEKYVEGLTKKVEKFDDAIERLGNVNTDKEKKQYAELLSGEYEQVQSNKEDTKAKLDADKKYDDSIKKRNKLLKEQEKYKKGSKEYNNIQKEINSLNKYISKHKEDNLTAEQRTKYQEYYNDLLEEEVDIRDEIEDKVREYYENQKEQAEQQAELTRKKKLYEKEVELYGEGGKDLWEYNNNKKIDEIQKVIDQRNAEKEALDDINEREELSNNLLEAKLKLQNALNNKITKILTKQEDGTWAYTFSANMSDVKSAKEEVDSAQKALDDYDWEQGTKKLESQIDELNANAENLSKQYEDAEFWADREYEQTMNNIEQVYGDIDSLVEQWMNTYGTTTDNLISSYQSLTNASIALENSLVDLTIKNNASYETVGSTNTIITKDGVKSFDTGGEIVGSGLAFVHDKERVLTQEQNANYMKLLDNIAYAKKLVDVSKINIQNYQQARESISDAQESQKAQTIIENVTCNFPNITTTDGLQKAILDLPRIALQRKK